MPSDCKSPELRERDYVLLYDKPAGVTSHDVVARVRRELPRKTKVGHAGTLDPFATGLLLVLVGRATRVQRFLMALPKRYEATARFGAVSSTGDPEGEIDHDRRGARGRRWSCPPAGSASARRPTRRSRSAAGAPTRSPGPARRSSCPSARSRSTASRSCWRDGDRRGFAIECSSGTYVRSLIADLGDAYCEQLRRTRIGASTSPTPIPSARSRSTGRCRFLPEVALDPEQARAGRPRRAVARPGPRGADRPADRRGRPGRAGRARADARDGQAGGRLRSEPLQTGLPRPGVGAIQTRLRADAGHELSEVAAAPRRVAVGEFDGVHLGHREVIAGSDTVLTFEPHPLAVIRPAGDAQAAHQPRRRRPS